MSRENVGFRCVFQIQGASSTTVDLLHHSTTLSTFGSTAPPCQPLAAQHHLVDLWQHSTNLSTFGSTAPPCRLYSTAPPSLHHRIDLPDTVAAAASDTSVTASSCLPHANIISLCGPISKQVKLLCLFSRLCCFVASSSNWVSTRHKAAYVHHTAVPRQPFNS